MRYLLPAIGAFLIGCGGDCLSLPCPEPIALALTITSANGSASVNATVDVTGGIESTMPCNGSCWIPGTAGAYRLAVRAPGFQPLTLNVTVTGTDPGKCGCPTVDQQHLDVKLTPAT